MRGTGGASGGRCEPSGAPGAAPAQGAGQESGILHGLQPLQESASLTP